MMRKLAALFLMLILAVPAFGEGTEQTVPSDGNAAGWTEAIEADISGLFKQLSGTDEELPFVDKEVAAINEDLARDIASEWKKVCVDPDYPILCAGKDDPAQLPIRGKHAFVVLGYALQDGEMADELKGRCDAAAEAVRAFPDSVMICTGGATGTNNPEKHTEAGLMKQYLTENKGIAADRIFTDEQAMSTADNAVNTFRILKEQGIETITIVTSSYHQRRAHMLYYLVAEYIRYTEGSPVELIGNFSFETENSANATGFEAKITARQMEAVWHRLTAESSDP